VNTLLGGPADREATPERPARLEDVQNLFDKGNACGMDGGLPDLDRPMNNDANAISGSGHEMPPSNFGLSSGAELRREIAFSKGVYYTKPVPVRIPRALEPFPPSLLQNRMNLFYFHHFLNHTARVMVPYDCPENPFRNILPQSKRNIY